MIVGASDQVSVLIVKLKEPTNQNATCREWEKSGLIVLIELFGFSLQNFLGRDQKGSESVVLAYDTVENIVELTRSMVADEMVTYCWREIAEM